MCILVIFIMVIKYANINCVTTEEQIDLDKLFFPITLNPIHTSTLSNKKPERNISYLKNQFNRSNKVVADAKEKGKGLLCWIPIYPAVHKNAIHIKGTWGKRCDILLFMSTEEDPTVPTVKLRTSEGRAYLWEKTIMAFQYIYQNYLNKADWFFKADMDTYVIVENLKFLLDGYNYNTNDPIYLGGRLNNGLLKHGYMDGGAGYVLNQKAVKRLVTQGLNTGRCSIEQIEWSEDVFIGHCLDVVGIMPMDSRDWFKRHRFFPFPLDYHIQASSKDMYSYLTYYLIKTGRECCSEYTVSFHHLNTNTMYALEYFVYHLRPYGISYEYKHEY